MGEWGNDDRLDPWGAFSLFRKRPGAIAILGLINLATTIATTYAIAALVGAQIMSGADTLWPFFRNLLLIYLVVAMIQVVLYAAALRAMLRPGAMHWPRCGSAWTRCGYS